MADYPVSLDLAMMRQLKPWERRTEVKPEHRQRIMNQLYSTDPLELQDLDIDDERDLSSESIRRDGEAMSNAIIEETNENDARRRQMSSRTKNPIRATPAAMDYRSGNVGNSAARQPSYHDVSAAQSSAARQPSYHDVSAAQSSAARQPSYHDVSAVQSSAARQPSYHDVTQRSERFSGDDVRTIHRHGVKPHDTSGERERTSPSVRHLQGIVSDLEARVRDLQSKNQDLQSRLMDVEAGKTQIDTTNHDLQSTVRSLESRNRDLEIQLRDGDSHKRQLAFLEDRAASLQTLLEQSRQKYMSICDERDRLEMDLYRSRDDVTQLTFTNSQYDSKIKALTELLKAKEQRSRAESQAMQSQKLDVAIQNEFEQSVRTNFMDDPEKQRLQDEISVLHERLNDYHRLMLQQDNKPGPKSILKTSELSGSNVYHSSYRLAQIRGEMEKVRGLFIEVKKWKTDLSSMIGSLQATVNEMQGNMEADVNDRAWLDSTKVRLENVLEQLTNKDDDGDDDDGMVSMLQDQVNRLLDQISSLEKERSSLVQTNQQLQLQLIKFTSPPSSSEGRLSEIAYRHDAVVSELIMLEQAIVNELNHHTNDSVSLSESEKSRMVDLVNRINVDVKRLHPQTMQIISAVRDVVAATEARASRLGAASARLHDIIDSKRS